MTYTKISRQELYAQVWAEPMQRLAKKYSMSDVGLAKICRQHNIPCPPRGYWAKLNSGKRVKTTALPKPDHNPEITLYLKDRASLLEPKQREKIEKEIIGGNRARLRPHVAESLRGAHGLVSAAKEELEIADVDEHQLLIPPVTATLRISTSKTLLRRSLLIMDALIRTMQEAGWTVSAGPKVEIGRVTLRFSITEILDAVKMQPKNDSLDGYYTFRHSSFITKHIPSGRLELRIEDAEGHWASGYRKAWRDTETKKLEHRLESFLVGISGFAVKKREWELNEALQAKRQREEEERREQRARERAEKLALIAEERARVDTLLQEAANWRKSQELEDYIKARTEKELACTGGSFDPDGDFSRWLTWAKNQALRLNPLIKSPPSILDESLDSRLNGGKEPVDR